MMILRLLLAVQTLASAPDSAYLSGDTLRVEPVGLRLTVPSLWMGRVPAGATPLATGTGRFGCQLMDRSPVEQRIITQREQLLARERYPYGTKQAYAQALDSIVPNSALVAHVGGVPFASNCLAPHVRIFVTDNATVDTSAFATVARREIERHYSPVRHASVDSAGWNIQRLSWTDSKTDFIHPGTLELWHSVVGERVVILAVMEAWSGQEDTAALLRSVR